MMQTLQQIIKKLPPEMQTPEIEEQMTQLFEDRMSEIVSESFEPQEAYDILMSIEEMGIPYEQVMEEYLRSHPEIMEILQAEWEDMTQAILSVGAPQE